MATDPLPKIRLHLEAPLQAGVDVPVERDQANYLFNVMRLGPGDRLRVFNGRDGEWLAEVAEAGKRGGRLIALEQRRPAAAPPDLWLLFAPLKKTRTDFIAEKATELGCRRLVPVFTERTNSERINAERLRAHAIEAAEQCELVFTPEVAAPARLGDVLTAWDPARPLYFCDERSAEWDAAPAPLIAEAARPGPAAILIGPEGGFSASEAEMLRAASFVTPVSLGPRILRADTAAVAAIALWQARAGDWG